MSETRLNGRRNSLSDDYSDGIGIDRDKKQPEAKLSKRAHLVKELVSTQIVFVTDMTHLYDVMKAESAQLTDEDGQALFACLDDVVKVSTKLQKCWNDELLKYASSQCDNALVASAAQPHKNSITEAFFRYATKYDVTLLEKNENVEEFVARVVKRLKESKPLLVNLNTELIKPVQRMFKYSQLFDQLKDHTAENHDDYPSTCEMFEVFRKLLRCANEDKRWNDILSGVFSESSKCRRARKLCRRLFLTDNTPTDPKLAQEKWKLDTLRNSAVSVRDWVKQQISVFNETLKLERKFLESTLQLCQPDGHICLHTLVGYHPSSFPIYCDGLDTQISTTDTVLTNLTFIAIPKFNIKITRRLDELLLMLSDPALLIEELQKTDKELALTKQQLQQSEIRNQPTTVLSERCCELEHTRDTLRNNLLRELPLLTRLAEKALFSISAHACLVNSNLSKMHAERMKSQLDKDKRLSQVNSQMNTDRYIQFIDEIMQRMCPEKLKGFFASIAPNSRITQKMTNKLLHPTIFRHSDSSSESFAMKRISDTVHDIFTSGTNSPTSGIRGKELHRAASDSCRVGSESSLPLTSTQRRGLRQVGFQYLTDSGQTDVPESSRSTGISKSKATHRATYNFTARSPTEVSMSVGQLVILLVAHDDAGNKEWFKVYVLPSRQIGYVPANYLSPI